MDICKKKKKQKADFKVEQSEAAVLVVSALPCHRCARKPASFDKWIKIDPALSQRPALGAGAV